MAQEDTNTRLPVSSNVSFITKEEAARQDQIVEEQFSTVERPNWEQTLADLASGDTTSVKIPRSTTIKRERVVQAFEDAFQLIGGAARLALWADENPGLFYQLYGKLIPKQAEVDTKHEGGLKIVHVLPRGKLDE